MKEEQPEGDGDIPPWPSPPVAVIEDKSHATFENMNMNPGVLYGETSPTTLPHVCLGRIRCELNDCFTRQQGK